MNPGDIVSLLLLAVVFGAGIAALVVILDTFLPRLVRRARNTAERMPVRAGVVGLINLLFFGALALIVLAVAQNLTENGAESGAELLRLIALVIVTVLGAFLALGLATTARWVGERMLPNASPLRQVATGVVTLELGALAPLVGWFLIPLVVVTVGYGAVIVALVWRRDA